MQAEVRPLFELYNQANTAYVIPSYQRPFSWSNKKAEELLDAVLEDVTAGESLTVLGTILICPVPTGNKHPLGTNTPSSNAPQTIYEVVDGQQRMTTFALIGHALKKRLDTLVDSGLAYQPTHDFENMYRASRGYKKQEVPALVRDGDNFDTGYKSELAQLLYSFIHHETSPLAKGNRLHDMKDAIDKWTNENLNQDNFGIFAEYFLTKCHYVHVVADDQNTAFAMFEPLNSTSEPLTAFEVYRSNVTRNIAPVPKFEKVESLLDYSHAQRDEVIARSNNLIYAVAQAFDGQRPKKTFNRLKVYLDDKVNSDYVKIIEEAADFYARIWYELPGIEPLTLSDVNETLDSIRFLRASSHDAPIPLLVRYYHEKPEWLPAVVKIVAAFFTLWRVGFETGALPSVYRELFKSSSKHCINLQSGIIKTPAELAAYFRNALQEKLGKPPQGEQYIDVWLRYQRNLNYENQKTICRFIILQNMKETLKENFIPNDPWTKVDDIEHLASQNGVLSSDIGNLVGNLTVLPPGINRSIQNAPWDDKREIFELLSKPTPTSQAIYSDGRPMPPQVTEYIASNSVRALSYLQEMARMPHWGEAEIISRNQEVLTTVWNSLWGKWLNPS
jgi:uncharacterized protein with ParB-like and HNH nuclease domain